MKKNVATKANKTQETGTTDRGADMENANATPTKWRSRRFK